MDRFFQKKLTKSALPVTFRLHLDSPSMVYCIQGAMHFCNPPQHKLLHNQTLRSTFKCNAPERKGALHLGIRKDFIEWKMSITRNSLEVRCTWIIFEPAIILSRCDHPMDL